MAVVDFAPHNMTSTTTPSPYVVTAYSPSYFSPHYAFAGSNAALYWIGNSTSVWLQIYIGTTAKILHSYALQMNQIPEPNRAPKDWTMQGSNDGSSWDTLDTVTGEITWTSGEKRTFECDVKTTAYNYFKIVIAGNNGDGSYTQIEEMFLYEEKVREPLNFLQYRGRNRLSMLPVSDIAGALSL